jgi:hypothetical protein
MTRKADTLCEEQYTVFTMSCSFVLSMKDVLDSVVEKIKADNYVQYLFFPKSYRL